MSKALIDSSTYFDMLRAPKHRDAAVAGGLYGKDWELRSIVERQFIVLGEAILRIRDLEAAVFERLPDSSRIVGFRNFLVHAYDKVLPERVFQISQSDLPILEEILKELVEEAQGQGL